MPAPTCSAWITAYWYDVDDVVGAPDEGIQPRADAVGVEDDEAPGDLDQDGELPLHAGQRQAVDARGDMAMNGGARHA